MNIFIRILQALQRSREREARRIVRRHGHLVREAHGYDRRWAAEKVRAAGRSARAIDLEARVTS